MNGSLSILHGYCTIQLKRRVGGNNYNQHTIQRKLVGNVLVDEKNFHSLNYDVLGNEILWLMGSNGYAYRIERTNGKKICIYMAREVSKLPRNPGRRGDKADHKNFDIWDNTEDNLRVVTSTQSVRHRRKHRSNQRFKGYSYDKRRNTYWAHLCISRLAINFNAVLIDVEAALMYNYAAHLIYGEHAELNWILDKEMPNEERQWELYYMVLDKLKEKGFSVAA